MDEFLGILDVEQQRKNRVASWCFFVNAINACLWIHVYVSRGVVSTSETLRHVIKPGCDLSWQDILSDKQKQHVLLFMLANASHKIDKYHNPCIICKHLLGAASIHIFLLQLMRQIEIVVIA